VLFAKSTVTKQGTCPEDTLPTLKWEWARLCWN